ncbi:MAG: tRNA (N6-threonylcarbamoyladenosine(37)-N6)-methyltransferase TrmO [Desulfobacterales bacterium]|nr:tRNA (N6-threonylcarbamoyladenosine(37)-N6)-methyltransferase TrmO [Desulfobacteraceae bacterium]MDY0312622.1 tRNA (N6-threonylcarbamoyladenosine(37)-N6)-methyltransferase TrmO [Desulfobacterales bacterium]
MPPLFLIHPIGAVRRQGDRTFIDIDPSFSDGLLGLDGFSHIMVCYWLDRSDTPEARSVLRTHPRADPSNPLTGVFATHSPRRPNPVAISLCRLISVSGTTLEIDRIDAMDDSPVIDIKCFIPSTRFEKETVRLPDWV